MKKLISSWLIIIGIFSCNTSQNINTSRPQNLKTGDIVTGEKTYIVKAPVVRKEIFHKNGDSSGRFEYYLSRSIQDYFIKFCESKVGQEELEKQLENLKEEVLSITLEVEFRNGNWDTCETDTDKIQGRVGSYVILKRIILDG